MVVAQACGAVRHGAECFNFYFPQELDPDFLVVWEGLESPHWKVVNEPELRSFLLERAKEGYSFPINPVWPVRDPGWHDVLLALQKHEESAANLRSWFPPESGVLERIEQLHTRYPHGFKVTTESISRRSTYYTKIIEDCDTRDVANYADLEVRRETAARWRRIRGSVKMHMLSAGRASETAK